jgi:hypothetical protein
VKAVGPTSVLEHIQYQGDITFEPRTLNLEAINLGPIYLNYIMFAHDSYHSQINILASGLERNAIDLY